MNTLKQDELRRNEFLNSLVQLSTLTAPNTSFYLFYKLMSLRASRVRAKRPFSHIGDNLWWMLFLNIVDTKSFALRIPFHFILMLSKTNKIGFVRDSIKTRLQDAYQALTRSISRISRKMSEAVSSLKMGLDSSMLTGQTSNSGSQHIYQGNPNFWLSYLGPMGTYTYVPTISFTGVRSEAYLELNTIRDEIRQRRAISSLLIPVQRKDSQSNLSARSKRQKKSSGSSGKGIRSSVRGLRTKRGRHEFWEASERGSDVG